ncbi:MAG TPA: OmpA family protein [Bosea sp. (in: a-proteobacteria)]|jgi:outer membrane protein OmpA-like peptidoglycan-associated protein|uniref:OmpA family protein n=1 Tax=Bosea sp. (in: a-proteobacteria) TaxID=1871050 RepID=UPI002DDD9883|nr:OmpA family protein [Bosea sp. (in: a-proteobacteria)]HEV2555670.1 OmpA family protein [Bosea sp. (in: a-proteobacteria)]
MRKQPAITAVAILAAGLYVLAAPVTQAQTYKAEDIVKHFGPATSPFGATRGLCIGTEADCNKAGHAVKPAAAAAFDLVVRFRYNSDVLEPEARVNLDEFAKALKTPQLGASRFVVEGHTDAAGTPSYNLDLSERRAQAVVSYLRERGVDTAKLEARGYGQTKPVVADPFAGENRRVETRLRTE